MESTLENPFLTKKRFFILGVAAVMLSLSLFMSILAPLPIALALLFYGRAKTSGLIATGAIALALMGKFPAADYSGLVIFCYMSFIAFIIVEVVRINYRPSHTLVKAAGVIFFLIMGACTFWLGSQELPVLEFIEQKIVIPNVAEITKNIDSIVAPASAARHDIVALLSNTKYLTEELFVNFPFVIFAFLMVTLWLNGYLLLKARRLVTGMKDGIFSEFDLLSYQVPDSFVFALLVSLMAVLWGSDLGYPLAGLYGTMALKCLAVLYFFHGLGVLVQVLNFWNIRGFFRIAIVTLIVIIANWLLAAIGLFDTWFDFRRRIFLGLQDKE